MQQIASGEANRSSDTQEPPSILYKPRDNCRIGNRPPFFLNPVRTFLHLLILFYHLRFGLPSGYFPFGVHTKTLYSAVLEWQFDFDYVC